MLKEKPNKLRGIVRFVYKQAGKAIYKYKMIEDKDRVLIGFSAGADSVALANILVLRRLHVPIDFEIKVVYVNLPWQDKYLPKVKAILKEIGVPYTIKDIDFQGRKIDCFWCSWQRRKIFFTLARSLGCNKVALAHNLDDIIESGKIVLALRDREMVYHYCDKAVLLSGEKPNIKFCP